MQAQRSDRLTSQCHPPRPTAFFTTPVSPTKLCFVLLLPVTVTLVCRGNNAWPSSSSSWLALSLPEVVARLDSKVKIGGTVSWSCSLSGLAIRSVTSKPLYCLATVKLLRCQSGIDCLNFRARLHVTAKLGSGVIAAARLCFVYASGLSGLGRGAHLLPTVLT